MSWRRAAELVRHRAARATGVADQQVLSEQARADARRLVQADPAILDWCMRRVAQELELVAQECLTHASEDITVLERGRPK
jgi:hypothetical protein